MVLDLFPTRTRTPETPLVKSMEPTSDGGKDLGRLLKVKAERKKIYEGY